MTAVLPCSTGKNYLRAPKKPVFTARSHNPAHALDLKEFISIVRNGERYETNGEAMDRVRRSFEFLETFAKGKVIYGINTGFGPMAQRAIPEEHQIALQYNLIRSHAAGAGDPLPYEAVRAMMLVRIVTFLKGGSGVGGPVVQGLVDMLNAGVCPRVPEHGGVGASGDLTQQAHLALGLIGEGWGMDARGSASMKELMARHGLTPVELKLRDGLALINGTACMTGIGLLNIHHAQVLLDRAIEMGALLTEVLGTWDDHVSVGLNEAKHHRGQREVAERARQALTGSKLTRDRSAHHGSMGAPGDVSYSHVVQEQYSIRCVPQILGPILDTLRFSEQVLLDELHSVDDNPVVVPGTGVFHGGNFHGDQVSLEMDKLRLAVVKLSMLTERQLNLLLNDRDQDRFPPFLNMETPGLTLGMQGMQFTATSTVAENQALATSLYVHSITCNNENQDVVSMGTNAANATAKVLRNTGRIMAIQAIALAQAVDLQGRKEELSPAGRAFHERVRSFTPPIVSASDPAEAVEAVYNGIFQPSAA